MLPTKSNAITFCKLCRPFLQKDKNLIKKILLGMQSQRPGEVQTIILRKHLREVSTYVYAFFDLTWPCEYFSVCVKYILVKKFS